MAFGTTRIWTRRSGMLAVVVLAFIAAFQLVALMMVIRMHHHTEIALLDRIMQLTNLPPIVDTGEPEAEPAVEDQPKERIRFKIPG